MVSLRRPFVILLTLLTGLFAGCESEKVKNATQTEQKVDSSHISRKSDERITKALEYQRKSKSKDSARLWFDTIAYKFEESNGSFFWHSKNLLLPGVFHNEEVWDDVLQQEWLALYHRNGIHTLEKVKLRLRSVPDDAMDNPGDSTAWEVSVPDQDSCIVLLSDTSLRVDTLEEVVSTTHRFWPQDTFGFNFGSVQYELVVLGHRYPDVPDLNYYETKNYQLVLRGLFNDGPKEQVLFHHRALEESLIKVLWIGDLDNDQKPDLLIETSHHFNVSLPTLYLSGDAAEGQLIREFGKFRSVGC